MSLFSRLWRYFFLAVAVVVLSIGIKACSSPTVQQPAPSAQPASAPVANPTVSGKPKININTAILSELDKLEAKLGIPALSHRIQASRPYGSPEELVSKQVVSQAQFDQIKDEVTVAETILTGEAKDIDYLTKLGLMKGHMIVAGELLAANQPKQAIPHLGHPVEEIYVDLEEQLNERKVPAFKETLTRVQDLVKAKPGDAQVKPAYDQAMTAIDQAIAAIPETQRLAPKLALQIVNGLLETASSEYTAAISQGKIREAIEYQDSRGFVAYAETGIYQKIQAQVAKLSPPTDTKITATFKQLRQAWPTAVPPQTPVLTPDQVAAAIKTIEQASTALSNMAAS